MDIEEVSKALNIISNDMYVHGKEDCERKIRNMTLKEFAMFILDDTVKDLEYYKNRCMTLEQENKRLKGGDK